MQPAKVHVRGNRPGDEHLQEIIGQRFHHGPVQDQGQRLVFACGGSAVGRLTLFGLSDGFQHRTPSASEHGRTADGDVGPGDLQIDLRLLMRFAVGVQEPFGDGFIARLKTDAFVGPRVFQIVH